MWEYRESIFGTTAHKTIGDLHVFACASPYDNGYLSIVEAQDDQSVFYHRRRFLDTKTEAEIDLFAQINFIDSLTAEDFRKVAIGLSEQIDDYSEFYSVKYPHVKKAQHDLHPELVERILKEHQGGGSTFSLDGRNLIGTPNFSVSLYPERTVILNHPPAAADIINFIHKNGDLFKDTRNNLGTWFNEAGGEHWLDVVAVIPDRDTAIELGRRFDQIAIFDLQKMEEIQIGGTGKGLGSETYPSEMDRLPKAEEVIVPTPPEPEEDEEVEAAEESGVFDTHTPTSIQDPLPKARYQGKKHNPKAEAETEKIKENREKPENQKPHPFKAAEWTHPNGHPRCIRCGCEEPVGGQCEGYDPGERHFLAATGSGYWINYKTGVELKLPPGADHEDWVWDPNNAKLLGISDSVIKEFSQFEHTRIGLISSRC